MMLEGQLDHARPDLQSGRAWSSIYNANLKIQLAHCNENDISISREKMQSFKSWFGQ
jgi:hypothetical protein